MGQPAPPRIVEAFAINAGAGFITYPIPTPSQIGVSPEIASLNDGFPPATFTDPTAGGIPPRGKDFNGILRMLSAHTAALAAGQWYQYDATLSAAMGGYAQGAVLQQAANLNAFWISTAAANVTNPDAGGAGWLSTVALHTSLVAAAGTTHDQALVNASDQVLDIDTTAGAATFDSIVAQRDGQRLTVCNTGANLLTLGGAGGTAANRIRQNAAVSLLQNDSMTIQYCTAIVRWVVA